MRKETTHQTTLDVRGARRVVLDVAAALETEQAGLINALGRTLAHDVAADADLPCCPTAANDGYAAISSDTSSAAKDSPRTLSILSESSRSTKRLEPGTVLPIRRGQPLPEGADVVVQAGETYRPSGGPEVLILTELKAGGNVVPAGALAAAGRVIIRKGRCIGPGEMGVLAQLGMPGVPVTRKPKVAVITTGAGVVDVVETLEPGQIRNSVRYALVGMILEAGCDLGRLAHVRDGRIGIERAFAGLSECDAAIVALGPGDRSEFALQALLNTGSVLFDRVQMEPGAAAAFGLVEGAPVFVMSDDAVVEVFEALVRPGLLAMLGRDQVERPRIRAVTSRMVKLNPGCHHYVRAFTSADGAEWVAKPFTARDAQALERQQSNSLIEIPDDVETVRRGDTVEVILLTP